MASNPSVPEISLVSRDSVRIAVQAALRAAQVEGWTGRAAAGTSGLTLDAVSDADRGSFDRILVIRMLHNMTRQNFADSELKAMRSLLKPGGVIYGFFGTTATEVTSHVRYVVESKDSLRLGTTKSPRMQRHVLVNRDINKMFEGLDVAESVLLKSNTRETLFRKP